MKGVHKSGENKATYSRLQEQHYKDDFYHLLMLFFKFQTIIMDTKLTAMICVI